MEEVADSEIKRQGIWNIAYCKSVSKMESIDLTSTQVCVVNVEFSKKKKCLALQLVLVVLVALVV